MTSSAILVVSDRCYAKEMEDKAGPRILTFLAENGITLRQLEVLPDDRELIKSKLKLWCDEEKIQLIFTSGGTGFAPRDVTPEATKGVIEKEAPGLALAMLQGSLNVTPLAMLSRPVCGIRGRSLIINLPGSPKAVTECLGFVKPALKHALQLIADEKVQVRQTHDDMQSGSSTTLLSTPTKSCGHHHMHSIELDPALVARRYRESPYPMIEVEEAQACVLRECHVLGKTTVSLQDSIGCVTSEDLHARYASPPFPASMKDGYAVIAADGTGKRRVIGDASICGSSPELLEVRPGFCMRINTGAPLPQGADSVVMVEYTKLVESSEDGRIEQVIDILKAPAVGADIRPVGSDIQKGQVVLLKGTKIGPSEVGLIAAIGLHEIPVTRNPVVAVLSTGNELQDPSSELRKGKIYDSNGPMLLALLKKQGFSAVDAGIARDDLDSLTLSMSKALSSADVLVTTGGVSMGEKDLVRYILTTKFGATIHFARVNMKPGKPTTVATCMINGSKKIVFGLPGNPVSAMVTCHLYVIPACRKIMDLPNSMLYPTKIKVKLQVDASFPLDQRPEYHRATLRWNPESPYPLAVSAGNQLSSRLLSMHSANLLVILPASTTEVVKIAPGTIVDALVIDEL